VLMCAPVVSTQPITEGMGHRGTRFRRKSPQGRLGPETDPLGPENVLIFMTGPFAATGIPTSGRHSVTTKSPPTGLFGESDIGRIWGTAL